MFGGQRVHAVAPSVVENSPAAHGTQVASEGERWWYPSAHTHRFDTLRLPLARRTISPVAGASTSDVGSQSLKV